MNNKPEGKMAKILSLLIGSVVAILGLILFITWRYEFLFVIKGVFPLMLMLGGAVAVVAGFSELKDIIKDKK